MMGKMSLPTLQNGAPNYTIEGQKTMIVGMLTFSFSPVIFMVVGSYFSKTFTIRFLCIMQHSIVDFLSLMVEKNRIKGEFPTINDAKSTIINHQR